MERYTLLCTEEQTKKALELGAPINIEPYDNKLLVPQKCPKIIVKYPTTEQMINWLAEQEVLLCINPVAGSNFWWVRAVKVGEKYRWESHFEINKCKTSFNTRQEATLDAIDSALEYLINKKK